LLLAAITYSSLFTFPFILVTILIVAKGIKKYFKVSSLVSYAWAIYAYGLMFLHFIDQATAPNCRNLYGRSPFLTYVFLLLASSLFILFVVQLVSNIIKIIRGKPKYNKRKAMMNFWLIILLGISVYLLGLPIPQIPTSCTL